MRALLHGCLLRGLRAPRLPHTPGWREALSGGEGVVAFQVSGARGQTLAAWLVLPLAADVKRPVPVVVAVHGWGANGSTLSGMVGPLVRAGIAVVLFDAANYDRVPTFEQFEYHWRQEYPFEVRQLKRLHQRRFDLAFKPLPSSTQCCLPTCGWSVTTTVGRKSSPMGCPSCR